MTTVETKGNEPAFASVAYGPCGESHGQDGLTKRELFAAMAMQGVLANEFMIKAIGDMHKKDNEKITANVAVLYADALIKALNEPKE